MITTSEIISFIILIILGILVVIWIIDRICKCVEKCKSIKILGKYLGMNGFDKFMEDFDEAMKKGLGK